MRMFGTLFAPPGILTEIDTSYNDNISIVNTKFRCLVLFQRCDSFCALNTHFYHTPLLFHLKLKGCSPWSTLMMLGANESVTA